MKRIALLFVCCAFLMVNINLFADNASSIVEQYKSKGAHIDNDSVDLSSVIVNVNDLPSLLVGRNLVILHLKGKNITDGVFKVIKVNNKIDTLSLVSTSITDNGLKEILSLKIERLDLSKTNIDDEGLKIISGFSSLKDLVLNNTKITNKGIQYLVNLENLRGLELNGNLIDDGCIETLGKMKSEAISEIGIRGTRITKDGAKKLRKLLPGCTVFHK